jgi:hypothetical protein
MTICSPQRIKLKIMTEEDLDVERGRIANVREYMVFA